MSVAELVSSLDLLPLSTGEERHVSTTGSDGQPGTEEEPYRTYGYAMRYALPGDVIRVHPGRYESPWPDRVPIFDRGKTITMTAHDPDHKPVIAAFPYFRGMRDWRINRMEIDGTGLVATGDACVSIGASSLDGPASYMEISECDLHDFRKTNGHAHGFLRKEGAHHIDLINNTVRRIGANSDADKTFQQHGVYLSNGHHTRVIGNLFRDVYAGYGVHWWGSGSDDYVAMNTIEETYAAGITYGAPTGLVGPTRILIELNELRRTALKMGQFHVTNYRANGQGVVFRLNDFDDTKEAFDFRRNGGTTVTGQGLFDPTASAEPVGYDVFEMPNVVLPPADPCSNLRRELEELKAANLALLIERNATEALLDKIADIVDFYRSS